MGKIENPETKVPATIELNDRDYLNCMLAEEKNMSVNMTYALNEASNEELFKELYKMFENIKEKQRTLYECAFANGWYKLEEVEPKKIDAKKQSLQTLFDEFDETNE